MENVILIAVPDAAGVPPGGTGVIADVYEPDPTAIDSTVRALGLSASRMTRAEAEAQVKEVVRRFEETQSGAAPRG